MAETWQKNQSKTKSQMIKSSLSDLLRLPKILKLMKRVIHLLVRFALFFRKRKRVKTIAELPLGFTAKIDRAKVHFHALKSSVDAFMSEDRKAYTVVKEANREAREYTFRLRVNATPPLVEWSLLIGDCVHNARSALDHLFKTILMKSIPSGDIEDTSHTNFPIFKDFGGFNGRKKKLEGWGVDQAAIAKIEAMQPYNTRGGVDQSMLLFLHHLDIADKHKLLLPAMSVVHSQDFEIVTVEAPRIGPGTGPIIRNLLGRKLEHNAEIAYFKFPNPEDIMDVNFKASLQVIFEFKPVGLRVIPVLNGLIKNAIAIGDELLPFL